MSNPVRLVSATTRKILDMVAENRISLEDAVEIFDVMKSNGFATNHDSFFEALKSLATKISENTNDD
jgi:hypothetical protein